MKKNYKRDLQLCMLDMIKDIDKLCKKHNIEYYLAYGSCLGAVRHEGFIPWDDDLDIMLKYDQYVKFIEVCKKELDLNKYFVQTSDTEKNYYLSFTKIRNIQTTLIEEGNKDENIVRSVYIDVFPIVGYPDNKIKQKILEINRAFALSANRNVINNKFLYFIFRIILRIFGKKNILEHCTNACLKYKCDDYSKIVSVFDGDGIKINLTTNEVLGNPKYVKFEDTYLPIPEFYEEYLSYIYGDYMYIPNENEIKKKEHTPYLIDLNKPYKDYINEKIK